MHVGQIIKVDVANGAGIRLSVFVSGCTNHCEGCFQPETWDFNFGMEYTPEMEQSIIDELGQPHYNGITLLGGEPMEPENQQVLIGLIRRIKKELPTKNIWIYTGFSLDKDLIPGGRKYTDVTDEILNSTDILVDGRFMLSEKDISLRFRGSRNQRIIDLNATRAAGQIVLADY
ncbi:anaerobic ribonucleoside-triphosphate reductase activating protein [Butyrivibrio sp. MC2013]|uniref:anaerobic ribonucleoside-triphosphate reductase activating protein n=1 Tax=Butyrivibrio sp. MC2013 TaxID=1280686 RepID=UPI0003FA13FD